MPLTEADTCRKAALAGKRFRPAIEPPYRWRDWAANLQGITGMDKKKSRQSTDAAGSAFQTFLLTWG